MPHLRVLTSEDWPLWREVRLAALTQAPQAFTSRLTDWHRGGERQWREWLEAPNTHNLVATLDGRTAGMARGVRGDGDRAQLRSVWVAPGCRGRGVADALVTAVERWARRSGASTLELSVIEGNEPALALYRRHGFVGPARAHPAAPAGGPREEVMSKALR